MHLRVVTSCSKIFTDYTKWYSCDYVQRLHYINVLINCKEILSILEKSSLNQGSDKMLVRKATRGREKNCPRCYKEIIIEVYVHYVESS